MIGGERENGSVGGGGGRRALCLYINPLWRGLIPSYLQPRSPHMMITDLLAPGAQSSHTYILLASPLLLFPLFFSLLSSPCYFIFYLITPLQLHLYSPSIQPTNGWLLYFHKLRGFSTKCGFHSSCL